MTQEQIILDHLIEGNRLTKRDCINNLNIINCEGRISDLRGRGVMIETLMKNTSCGKNYAEYFIIPEHLDLARRKAMEMVRSKPKIFQEGSQLCFA